MLLKKIKKKTSTLMRQYYYSIWPDMNLLEELKGLKSLTVETSNICNSNCIFCGYQYMKRKKQVMNDDIYKKAINDFTASGGGTLSLTVVVGDPLLDPQFVERVKYARSFPVIKKISTITNCLNLHNVGSRVLLTSGIDEIGISTAAFDPDMYRTVFRNNMYEQMKQNVLDLLRTNNELGRPVKILVALRINKPIDEVIDSGGFNEVVALADSVDANHYFDSWGGRIKTEDLTGNMKIRPLTMSHLMIKKNPCSMMYFGLGVLADGTVTVCPCRDLDADSDLCIGNINNSSLHELNYSERLDALRKEWLAGAYIPDICRDCSHYTPYTYMMLSEIRKQLAPG